MPLSGVLSTVITHIPFDGRTVYGGKSIVLKVGMDRSTGVMNPEGRKEASTVVHGFTTLATGLPHFDVLAFFLPFFFFLFF